MVAPNGHFAQEPMASFFTLPGERILVATRKHWFILAGRICTTILLTIISFFATFFFFTVFFPVPPLFPLFVIAGIFALSLITTTVCAKIIVDWYFHLYVVTDRKILEVCYSPLFADRVSDVLLDQVRCTEVDVRKNSMLKEILNMGDIIITFDRPTHQQECVLADVKDAEKIGIFLGNVLVDGMRKNTPAAFWYKTTEKDGKPRFHFTEEIFPGEALRFN